MKTDLEILRELIEQYKNREHLVLDKHLIILQDLEYYVHQVRIT